MRMSLFTLQFTEVRADRCWHDIRQCPSPLTLHQHAIRTEGVSTVECVGH